jgi:dihydrolipoamide dehydrogenase
MAGSGRFDVVVIGSGPGGYVAAIRAAQLGLSTAIVEKDAALGGTCLNVGCIPSKALLDSSELYARTRGGLSAHCIKVGQVGLDLSMMMERKTRIVHTFTSGVELLMRENRIAVFRGGARLVSPTRVEVSSGAAAPESLEARAVILATGSVPIALSSLPFDGERIVSSTEALGFSKVPGRLLVVGAGAIGLELGSVWSRLGSKVTVIELLPQILPGWDGQVSKTLLRLLTRQGIGFNLSTAVTGFKAAKGGITLFAKDASGAETAFDGDRILVAVGRRPFTDGLGLEEIGVARDDSGRVPVDGRQETSVQGVYAIGDLTPGPMLAHKAEEEGIAAAECIAGKAGHVDRGTVPAVVYTDPEAASVGATEEALKKEGVEYVSGSFVFRANARALALEKPDGFVKVLADARTDRVLGVHIVGPSASDLISEAVVVMAFGGAAEDIARTIHAHPSLSEVVKEAALDAGGRPINAPPRESLPKD